METGGTDRHEGLPDSLSGKFGRFNRRLLAAETVTAVFGGLCGVLFTYAILLLSDRFWDTAVWLRVLLTAGGGLVFARFALRWLRVWVLRRRDARGLARIVQKKYPAMGDRLLGAVELASGDAGQSGISPALRRAAINQVAEEAERCDFQAAVDRKKPRLSMALFALAVAVPVAALVLCPDMVVNALRRWINPLSAVERFTFARLEDIPDVLAVPHGEEFEISCGLRADSRWKPLRASCRLQRLGAISTNIVSGRAVFRLPGQTRRGMLYLRVGDATRDVAIEPVYRPELVELKAVVAYPPYLGMPVKTNSLEGRTARFVGGSVVALTGRISRELGEASLARPSGVTNLETLGDSFLASWMPAESLGACVLRWKDSMNLECAEPCRLDISVSPDSPPLVDFAGLPRVTAILENEMLSLEVSAEDDFGLRDVWINWSAAGDGNRPLPDAQGRHDVTNAGPGVLRAGGGFRFSPIAARVPEDSVVALCAYASDYMPGRQPSISPVYRIHVLSKVRHAELLRERMTAVQSQVEDLAREEERLLNENKAISNRPPDELSSDRSAADIRDSAAAERQNAERLKDIVRRGDEISGDALKNSEIPESLLAEWAGMMDQLRGVERNEMSQAAASLAKAGSSQESRGENLGKAAENEQKAVDAMKKAEKDMNKAIENMVAQSFVNRLRAAARAEGRVGAMVGEALPRIIGAMPEDLDQETRSVLAGAVAEQDGAGKLVRNVEYDLGAFHNRTRMEIFKTIQDEMKTMKAVEKLAGIGQMIRDNYVAQVVDDTKTWQAQLDKWADQLQKKDGGGGGGDGGGGGQQLSEEDMEVVIALMRARKREEDLREQTRLAEERKDGNPRYEAEARKLSEIQYEVAADSRRLERKSRHPQLQKLVEKVTGEMMNAGMCLRRPKTDGETVAIETEIIELLSEGISDSMNRGSGGGMAALMRGFGMGAGRTGGGSSMGGEADGAARGSGGDMGGEDPGKRDVEKAGGLDRSDLPEEYREMIEAYYEAVEKEGPRNR